MKFNELLVVCEKLSISRKFIEIWVPESKFVEAQTNGESLSITRIDSPYFGFGFGPNPKIDQRWTSFALTRSTPKALTQEFQLAGQWDAYGIKTKEFEVPYEVMTDFGIINSLI